ncbi:MAG: hypothetical protein AAF961_16950 [Planctomycetota bacterium]
MPPESLGIESNAVRFPIVAGVDDSRTRNEAKLAFRTPIGISTERFWQLETSRQQFAEYLGHESLEAQCSVFRRGDRFLERLAGGDATSEGKDRIAKEMP